MKQKHSILLPGSFRLYVSILALTGAMIVSSCSTVKVSTNRGAVTRGGIESAKELRELSLVEEHSDDLHKIGEECELLLKQGRRYETFGSKLDAAGCYLASAVKAREHVASGHSGVNDHCRGVLVDLHNRSLARFADLWSKDPRRLGGAPYHFACNGEAYHIVLGEDSDFEAGFFDRAISADSLRGKGIEKRSRKGYGAALVGIREQTAERAEELEFFPLKGMHVPVTLAVSNVRETENGKTVELSIYDSARTETVQVGSTRLPLAADYSAPLEILLAGSNEVLAGLAGFLNAKKRAERAGIYLLEPYDEDRIPVILTHGLISVPIIWRDVIPDFLSEPDIAEKYQFLVFTYPSSYPIAESAELFRNQLSELREKYDPDGNDPLSTNVVAMGHSMGGVLTRLLVTDVENRLWDQVATVPIDQLKVDEENREIFRNLAFFDPDPAVHRAVFLSTPHGGAEMATLSIADAVSRLAKLPQQALEATTALRKGPMVEGMKIDFRKKMTSVQSLRPDSPIVLALKESPYRSGVVYHSIIGDQGIEGPLEESSDGIVDYWSSHQPGASSEVVVPTGHSTYVHENAKKEMKRILRVHARR